MPTSTRSELARYLRTETVGGILLLVAAAAASLWVNSPWGQSYLTLTETRLAIPPLHLDLTLADWVEDGPLAVFFFVAGLTRAGPYRSPRISPSRSRYLR